MGPPLPKKMKMALLCTSEEFFFGNDPPNSLPVVLTYMFAPNDQLKWSLCLENDSHTRIQSYFESWLPQYLEHDFYLLFRMNKSTFHELVNNIGHHVHSKQYRGGRFPVEIEKAVLIAVAYLARGETMLSLSDRFNVAVCTVFNCRDLVVGIMSGPLLRKFIKRPSMNQAKEIEKKFKEICGFPGVIGAIDGCHIKAKIPLDQHDSYQDRKFQHTISMQAICSSSKLFLNVSSGYPGSLHDARILKESKLSMNILAQGEEIYFYGKYHLLGDSAYPCKNWLLAPYRDTGNMSRKEKYFNQSLSKTRVPIENSFGLLKNRWRILRSIDTYSVGRAVQIINACCMLHNFCLIMGDTILIEEEGTMEVDYHDRIDGNDDIGGMHKRRDISEFLWQNKNL